jgi:hypothetical protein
MGSGARIGTCRLTNTDRAPSSLREFDRPADRIRLHRQAAREHILIVEGESDKRLCARCLPVDSRNVFVIGTRDSVLNVVTQLNGVISGFTGVVDRDFDDRVSEMETDGAPVVSYDNFDLEAMAFQTPAFDHMLNELASSDKLQAYGGVDAVRRDSIGAALLLSRLRRMNSLNEWGIKFDAQTLGSRVKNGDIALDERALCASLISLSPNSSANLTDLLGALSVDPPRCVITNQYGFRGKDALAVVGTLLRRQIGSMKLAEIHESRLAKVLRLAISRAEIEQTVWYERILDRLALGELKAELGK